MEKKVNLIYNIAGEDVKISFGKPNSEDELEKMYRFRYSAYLNNDYIYASDFKNEKDIDSVDLAGDCEYFIAKFDDKIIGTARIIKGDILPIQDYFSFKIPKVIKKFSSKERIELGRLVADNRVNGGRLPRHIILLFLIYTIQLYSEQYGYKASFAFVKDKLFNKLKKLRFPMRVIKFTDIHYPRDGVLYKYFNQKKDPVIPIYFTRTDVEKYTNRHILNGRMFQKVDGDVHTFKLRKGLYIKFLKLLNII